MAAEDILQILRELFSPMDPYIPPFAYHKTDSNGIQGIIKSKCLWATRMHDIVDQAEFSTFDALCDEILPTLKSGEISQDRIIDQVVIHLREQVMFEKNLKFYVVCFSAPNPSACGVAHEWSSDYALKISPTRFQQRIAEYDGSNGPAFRHVYYDEFEQRKSLRETAVDALQQTNADRRAVGDCYTEGMQVNNIAAAAGELVFLHKKPYDKYKKESEWRVVKTVTMKNKNFYKECDCGYRRHI
ncbi:MAG: hypothetical protein M3Y56_02025, partial [Armatimonadota bacterium]|nr:hypothetical protein [Armatimonadota bacterium]